MKPASGLTLIEVIAALVLLTSLGLALGPMILDARRAVRASRVKSVASESQALGELADEVLADPRAWGFAALPREGRVRGRRAPLEGQEIRFRAQDETRATVPHRWMVFQGRESVAVRYVSLPKSSSQDATAGAGAATR